MTDLIDRIGKLISIESIEVKILLDTSYDLSSETDLKDNVFLITYVIMI